jgi:ABC-type transport system substrate-binding protein
MRPEGPMTWGAHISLAPTWFDPAETSGIITPFMVIYALQDAMLKAMPGNPIAPSLAESWSMSSDGLVYDFVLRKGVKFHNGDTVTAEDVKFSLERYRGASAKALKESVAVVETPDPGRVRIRLKRPWPDFMTFYLGATGAAWIVPKKYVEKVCDEGYKRMPIGAGPYRFVSFTPGVELVLEAFDQYWRKFDGMVGGQAPAPVAKINWSIIPSSFEFYWQPPGYSYDRARAKQLLAEAGYPNGFDAGDYFCDAAIVNIGEPVVNYLNAAGIRVKLRPIERAAATSGMVRKEVPGADPWRQRRLRQCRDENRGLHRRGRHLRLR